MNDCLSGSRSTKAVSIKNFLSFQQTGTCEQIYSQFTQFFGQEKYYQGPNTGQFNDEQEIVQDLVPTILLHLVIHLRDILYFPIAEIICRSSLLFKGTLHWIKALSQMFQRSKIVKWHGIPFLNSGAIAVLWFISLDYMIFSASAKAPNISTNSIFNCVQQHSSFSTGLTSLAHISW